MNDESIFIPSPWCTGWSAKIENVGAKQPALLPPLSLLFLPGDLVLAPQNPKRKHSGKLTYISGVGEKTWKGQEIDLV